jgi:transcription elongation factor Elf1
MGREARTRDGGEPHSRREGLMPRFKCAYCGHGTLVRSNMKCAPNSRTYTCRGVDRCRNRCLEIARALIKDCEADLRRKLEPGERRDLLMDQTSWPRSLVLELEAAYETSPG